MLLSKRGVRKGAAIEYSTFYLYADDDVVFFGQLPKARADITPDEFTSALERVPDRAIFPPVPSDTDWIIAPKDAGSDLYIKRPMMSQY